MNTNQKRYTDEEKKKLVTQFTELAATVGKRQAGKQLGVSPLSIKNWTATKKPAAKKVTTTKVLSSPVTSNTGNGKVLVILGEASYVQSMLQTALDKMN